MYTVTPVSKEFIALEKLTMEVKKHNDGELPKEVVHNSLQEHREHISDSMRSIIEYDKKTAGEYLDNGMQLRYQQRVADLTGELLGASSKLNAIAQRGELYIIPVVTSVNTTRKICTYSGRTLDCKDAQAFLRAVRLYNLVLKSTLTVFDRSFFTSEEKATKALSAIGEKLESFESPIGKFVVKINDEKPQVEWSQNRFSTTEGFEKAGWSITKLTDYQTQFCGHMVEFSKTIYEAAQNANRFMTNNPEARSISLFTVFLERLVEALIRISEVLVAQYSAPWVEFRKATLS